MADMIQVLEGLGDGSGASSTQTPAQPPSSAALYLYAGIALIILLALPKRKSAQSLGSPPELHDRMFTISKRQGLEFAEKSIKHSTRGDCGEALHQLLSANGFYEVSKVECGHADSKVCADVQLQRRLHEAQTSFRASCMR